MFIYHMDFRDEKKEALINIAMVYSSSFLSLGSAKIIEPHIRATLLRGNIYAVTILRAVLFYIMGSKGAKSRHLHLVTLSSITFTT